MSPYRRLPPLTEAELEELEQFLFSDAVSEDALDYFGVHGLFCALAICPQEVTEEEWLEVIFDGTPGYRDDAEKARIELLLARELSTICTELEEEEPLELPCELDPDDEESGLISWCQAFMEGVFLREEAWFSQHEEQVAEMLLPIMLASELFDDPEIRELRRNRKLARQLIGEIPELLTDLYLLFRVPAEKAGAPRTH